MVLLSGMDPPEDGENWMEEQWEKWIIEMNNNSPPSTFKCFQANRLELPRRPMPTISQQQMDTCRPHIAENHDHHYSVPSLEELATNLGDPHTVTLSFIDGFGRGVACHPGDSLTFFHYYLTLQFFHCYCPVGFGRRTDPSGDFIRRYIAILKDYPNQYIYEQWNAPQSVQKAANCVVGDGVDYPKPMINHAEGSRLNIERMKQVYQQLPHYRGLRDGRARNTRLRGLSELLVYSVGSSSSPAQPMVLLSGMDPPEDGENWMEEQWEKWLTHEFSLDEFEDEDLSDVTEITDKYQEDDHVASWLANSEADRGVEGGWDRQGLSSLELIDAEETAETEGGGEGEQKEATGGGGEEEVVEEDLVRAAEERLKWRDKTGEGEEEEAVEEEEGGERKATLSSPGGEESSSAVVAMDTFRPKRPTTLALFPPQQPKPPRSQDTINNNSLGRKDSRKESRSASPHVSGAQHKEEDKGRHKRPAPKPPLTKGAVGRTSSSNNTNATPAADAPHTRPRDRPPPPPGSAARTQSAGGAPTRSQRRGAGGRGGAGGGTGRGGVVMRDRTLGENRGNKDVVGGSGGKEERRGRLCDDAKAKEKDKNGPQRSREGLKAKGAHDGKGRGAARASSRGGGGGGVKSTERAQNNPPVSQEIYLTAMVVPRTPVVPRNQEKTQEPVGDPDRSQDCPSSNMSRSSSSSTNSNRMSIGSDTEGPPGLSLRDRSNPDISEEEGEEDTNHHLHPLSKQNGPTQCLGVNHDDGTTTTTETDCTESGQRRKMDPGGGRVDNEIHGGQDDCVNSNPTTTTADDDGGFRADRQTAAVPHSESAAGLNYDSVKYTLVVDEHAQLELVSLKNCYNSSCTSAARDDDSDDAETIYQSANEEEDPELDDERKKKEEKRPGKCKQVRQIEEERERREELLKRIEEERQRRRGMVTVSSRLSKQVAASRSTSAEDGASGATGRTPRSKKFLNLFVNSSTSSHYSATGADSFGLFSCVLDGVERMQSHRAVYRFVPRHADELHLDKDDPVLMLAQSEDLWCQGYNMRSGATGIFPAFYAVKITKDASKVHKDGWIERFFVRFLGSVQVPFHQGNDVLSAAMQKVACNRRSAMQPPSSCVLEVSVKGLKMSVQDLCHAADRGDQCFHFFQLKNISFCGCHPKHNKYFGFISKHPDQERFACHVVMSDMTSLPLAESVGRAFKQYYKEHVGYSCPTEDIFIE